MAEQLLNSDIDEQEFKSFMLGRGFDQDEIDNIIISIQAEI